MDWGRWGGGRGRGEIHWPGGRDKVETLGQGRVVKNAGGGWWRVIGLHGPIDHGVGVR